MAEQMLFEKLYNASMDNQLITFKVGNELYGIEILKIQELIAFKDVTPVPNLPDFIIGVINLRGNVIPVIDLRKKFSMTSKEYNKFNVIIVLSLENRMVGVVVDSVQDVVSLPESMYSETPNFTTKIDTAFIKSISNIDGNLVVILDTEKILSLEEAKKV